MHANTGIHLRKGNILLTDIIWTCKSWRAVSYRKQFQIYWHPTYHLFYYLVVNVGGWKVGLNNPHDTLP